AAQVSPDGRTLALDVLGVLWTVPVTGGTARRLTSDLYDIAQPEWSPDGRALAFQSYRDGVFNLWTIDVRDGAGGNLRQLTRGPYDHREPRWSPDGRSLAFSSDLSGSYGVYTCAPDGTGIAAVADTAAEEYVPAWSPDGRRIAFVVANTRIDVVELATGARSTLVTVPTGQVIHNPAWTPDGSEVLYPLIANGRALLMRSGSATPVVDDEEVFPFRASWLPGGEVVYTAGGHVRRRPLAGGAGGTA